MMRLKTDRIIGYAFVVADLLHIGHLRFLQECKRHCDYLVVGVYTDELTETYKRKPVIPFWERIQLVKALSCVDEARKVTSKDATPMLKQLVNEGYDVRILFHGDDWKPEDVLGKRYIESIGGKLVQPPYYRRRSTTRIIEKIKEKY